MLIPSFKVSLSHLLGVGILFVVVGLIWKSHFHSEIVSSSSEIGDSRQSSTSKRIQLNPLSDSLVDGHSKVISHGSNGNNVLTKPGSSARLNDPMMDSNTVSQDTATNLDSIFSKNSKEENSLVNSDKSQHAEANSAADAISCVGEPAPAIMPAAMIEIGDKSVSDQVAQARLREIAEEFTRKMNQSGMDPASAEYDKYWRNEQWLADMRFKVLYGDSAWMRHHNAVRIEALEAAKSP